MDFGFLDSTLSDADYCLHEMYKWESRSDDRMNHWPRNHESFLRLCEIVRDLFERGNQERDAEIKAWKAKWESRLTSDERKIYNFMQSDPKSLRYVYDMEVPGIEGVTESKKRFGYEVGGDLREVTAVCSDYFKLLKEMVADAKHANL